MDVFDAIEVILIRSAVKDLIPWKRVCKSWYSLITSPSFAKAHLKHYNDRRSNSTTNKELGHVRIAMPSFWKIPNDNRSFALNVWKVVGSSNGLVCISLLREDFIVLVNNPWTRELRQVPMAPLLPENIRSDLCLSFGYDSSTDDYKIVMGVKKPNDEVAIHVLSLKSDNWKLIGHVKYYFIYNRPGILLNGALHWIVQDYKNSKIKKKKVLLLLSFNLSLEEFKVIPQPNDSKYVRDSYNELTSLGYTDKIGCVRFDPMEACFSNSTTNKELGHVRIAMPSFWKIPNDNRHDIWVMRNYNVEQSWELLPNDCEMKYEVVHHMKVIECNSPQKITMSFFCDDNKCLSRDLKYIDAHIFAPSLVSPFVNSGRPSHTKNKETSVKAWSIKESKLHNALYLYHEEMVN
nr:hypothetical protein [Tanacetum cinerariifolium]